MRVFHVFHQTKANFFEIRSVWISDFIDVWIGDWKRGWFSRIESDYRKDSIFFETGSMPGSGSTTFFKTWSSSNSGQVSDPLNEPGYWRWFSFGCFRFGIMVAGGRHHNLHLLDHSILCLLLLASQNAGSISLYMDYSRQSKTKLAFLILRIKM